MKFVINLFVIFNKDKEKGSKYKFKVIKGPYKWSKW
jgi:hypothetical protein